MKLSLKLPLALAGVAGALLAADAGRSMGGIVQSVQRVTEMMGELSTAAREQRDGIGQVNQAMSNLDDLTQQNSALVEESAAAAASLKDQAARLAEVVSVFRTEPLPAGA